MIMGNQGGKDIMALNGRFHYYEGYPMGTVTYHVQVMELMGIRRLVVSNAAGGINPAPRIGDIMIINDHINMIPEHPLRGKNIDELGPRFVDMKDAYNPAMNRPAKEIAAENGIDGCEGVYLALQGPTLEKQARYRVVSRAGSYTGATEALHAVSR